MYWKLIDLLYRDSWRVLGRDIPPHQWENVRKMFLVLTEKYLQEERKRNARAQH